jgi:hypothetical protein
MKSRAVRLLPLLVILFLTGFTNLSAQSPTVEPSEKHLSTAEPFIYRIAPDARGGEAYKLVYLVPVPIELFWKFKTDFHGDFVETNKYVINQRVIREEQKTVIIENRLSTKPDSKFRWRNILYPDRYRLDFFLVSNSNPSALTPKFPMSLILIFSALPSGRIILGKVACMPFWITLPGGSRRPF